MRMLPLFLVLTATVALAGTGPEFPVDVPAPAEAPYTQSEPAVASNGSDFFAVWRDERSTRDTFPASTLFGSRVDAAGHFAQPYGVAIADNVYRSAIASNGHGYLLLFSTYDGLTFANQIADDGSIQQPTHLVTSGSYIDAVASNGNGFLALTSDPAQSTFDAWFLDTTGVPIGGPIKLGRMKDPSLVVAGNDYRIVDLQVSCDGQTACLVNTRLTSINATAHTVSQMLIGPLVSQWSRVNAITMTDRIFVALISDGIPSGGKGTRTVILETLDFEGHIVNAPREIASMPEGCICGSWRPSLATDGYQVLVAWPRMRASDDNESNSSLVGVLVRHDATIVDVTPFEVASGIAYDFAAATSQSGVLLLSAQRRNFIGRYNFGQSDVFATQIRLLGDLPGAQIEDTVVESAAGQFDSAVATSGSRAVIVWRELDQPSAIRASVANISDSSTASALTLASRSNVTQTGPSVATLGDVALAVWREESPTGVRILAKRIGLDGSLRDAQPIIVAAHATQEVPQGITSVASDGSQFLVVWNYDQDVFAARVLADGTLLDQQWIPVSRDETVPHYHFRVNPRVIWTGTSFLVTWGDDTRPPGLVSPPLSPQTIVRAARVSPSGAVLDLIESPLLVNVLGPIADVVTAVNHGNVMIAWAGNDQNNLASPARCVEAMPVDANLRPQPATITQVGCDPFANSSDIPLHPALTSKNDGFLALWSANSTRDVRARFLSPSGIAGAAFTVSPPGSEAWAPAAADSPFGTVVTYDRIAPEPQYGGSPRVFGRVIDSIPAHKQRSAKH